MKTVTVPTAGDATGDALAPLLGGLPLELRPAIENFIQAAFTVWPARARLQSLNISCALSSVRTSCADLPAWLLQAGRGSVPVPAWAQSFNAPPHHASHHSCHVSLRARTRNSMGGPGVCWRVHGRTGGGG